MLENRFSQTDDESCLFSQIKRGRLAVHQPKFWLIDLFSNFDRCLDGLRQNISLKEEFAFLQFVHLTTWANRENT